MKVNIWSVSVIGWDGIEYLRLFSSECSAKIHAREKNRKCGIKDYYKVSKEEVYP